MLTLFNILIIALVLLIAYWWANQGLFSAILHLVAVIAAGIIAFGVWEPLSLLMLSGSGFDSYAWGVVLVGVFGLALVIMRFGLDRIAPANVDLPHWANLTFGFPIGAVAGVLTMGMFLIGAGHVQSQSEIMGLKGYARSERTGRIDQLNSLWLPVHTITADVYGWLSVSSCSPLFSTPLRHANPQLDRQAVSLIRDSYRNGRGAITMPPDALRVQGAARPTPQEVQVALEFRANAIDYSEQLTLSSSQVRLIGEPASRFAEAPVVHPYGWRQSGTSFQFNAYTYYATSTPGQETANLTFLFSVESDFQPAYIQVRGTRFPISSVQEGGVRVAATNDRPDVNRSAPNIDSAVEVTDSIRPVLASVNSMPSSVETEVVDDEHKVFSTGGRVVRFSSRERPSGRLALRGIFAPVGTKIVQVDAGPRSSAYIFRKSIMDRIDDNATLRLVDTNGNTYSCIGYMQIPPDNRVRMKLDPSNFVRELGDLVILPQNSEDDLRLIFKVTENVTVEALMFGDVTVGTCSVFVDPEDQR